MVDENTGNVVEDVQQDEEYADMNFDQYWARPHRYSFSFAVEIETYINLPLNIS